MLWTQQLLTKNCTFGIAVFLRQMHICTQQACLCNYHPQTCLQNHKVLHSLGCSSVQWWTEREIQLRLQFRQIFRLTTDPSTGLRSLGLSGDTYDPKVSLYTPHGCGHTTDSWRDVDRQLEGWHRHSVESSSPKPCLSAHIHPRPSLPQPSTSPWLMAFLHQFCLNQPRFISSRKLLLAFTRLPSQHPLILGASAGFRGSQTEPQSAESHF